MSESESDSDDDPSAIGKAIRTVTPLSKPHRNTEMDVIGWVILLVLLVVAIPLLPLFVVYWVVDKALGTNGETPE